MRRTLGLVAPGTPLRDGLERILRGRTGTIVVLGHDKVIDAMSGGGFALDVDFTSTGLRELAKMDGALILDEGATRILRAGVQLLPDASLPTVETGTRHRTADRVSQQTEFAVIAVSKSMSIIAVYVNGERRVIEDSASLLTRANQALATLERYKSRLVEVSHSLSSIEVEDLVTVRDVALVAQRGEMVSRFEREIEDYTIELGTDGRLVSLQLAELVASLGSDRELLLKDYLPATPKRKSLTPERATQNLAELSQTELPDLGAVAKAIGFGSDGLDDPVSPHGYRLLGRIPRLPEVVVERLVDKFGTLQRLLAASIEDLQTVEGVGETRARSIREGLTRLAESSFLERYV